MSSQFFDETFTALRVCITTVHETVDECPSVQSVFPGNITQFEQMIERRVNTTIGSQTHEVDILPVFFCIRES